MKKIAVFFLVLFLSSSFLPYSFSAKTMNVGVYQDKPLIFTTPKGRVSGFYADLLRHIAKKEGWDLKFVPGSWDECMQRLQSGEIDILAGVPYSGKETGKLVFTNVPIITNWAQVYTRRNAGIQTILDLNNRTVAGVKNNIYFEDIRAQIESFCPACNIVEMGDNDSVFKFLSQGLSDAGITDAIYGMQHEREYGLTGISIVSSPKELYFALPPNADIKTANALDRHLFSMKKNGNSLYRRSFDRWMGGSIRWVFPLWVIFLIIAITAALIVFLVMNTRLKRTVSEKTAEAIARNKELAEEIQERKWAHDKLSETLIQLEKRIKERTVELSDSNELLKKEVSERKAAEERLQLAMDKLARSNKELEQFAYVVSHDLKEPLRMVTGYLELLEKRYKKKLDKDAGEFIDFAKDGAVRMQSLIEDLLEYSRLTTRERELSRVKSSDVLDNVLGILKIAIEKNKAEITSGMLPEVLIDPTQLSQVFQNLIGNAIKFHGKEAPRIHIAAERKDNQWLFSVKDNGIGMEQKDAERIFVLFQRLHTREKYPGTGVGLAICKKIVESYGGRIWAVSEPGKGATFYFTLPDR